MRSVNRVTLLGQMLQLPEVRSDGQKKVCNFELETVEEWSGRNGPERRETIHTCVAFGPIAKTIEELRPGEHLYVEGALRPDRDSGTNYAFEVVCFVAIPVGLTVEAPA